MDNVINVDIGIMTPDWCPVEAFNCWGCEYCESIDGEWVCNHEDVVIIGKSS